MKELSKILCCPLEGGELIEHRGYLKCRICRRKYRITEDGILDFIWGLDDKTISEHYGDMKKDSINHRIIRNYFYLMKKGPIFERIYHNLRARSYKKVLEHYLNPGYKYLLDMSIGASHIIKIYPPDKKLFGNDINIEALKICSKHIRGDGSRKYLLVRSNIYKLPFQDNSLDLVTCWDTLDLLNEKKTFDEVSRTLKRKGIFIVSAKWRYCFLWKKKIRSLIYYTNFYSHDSEVRKTLQVNIKTHTKKDLKFISDKLRCVSVFLLPHLTELVGVYEKL